MSKTLSRAISITLMVLSAVIGIYTFIRCMQLDALVPAEREAMMGVINPMFVWMGILILVAILALIIVPIPYIISNPGVMKKFGLGIVVLGVVLLLAYLLSSDAPLPFVEDAAKKNGSSRLADMNIISIYIMLAAAALAIVVTGVRSMLTSNK